MGRHPKPFTAPANSGFSSHRQLGAENSHRLARRAATPISPQRLTLGDLAVRRTVRVNCR
jgi:hypothetical protein